MELSSAYQEVFLLYNTVIQIHPVKQQAQVAILRNHVCQEHHLKILMITCECCGKSIAGRGALA